MISNLSQNKNIKWLYWVPVVIGSAYIIELILGLSLLSGILGIFSNVTATIDERSKANERSAAFEFTDQFFYRSSYDKLVNDYEEIHNGISKNISAYSDLNIDFRDRLQEHGSRLGRSTYAQNKKKILQQLTAGDRAVNLKEKAHLVKQFNELRLHNKAGTFDVAMLGEYRKQLKEHTDEVRSYLASMKTIIQFRNAENHAKLTYLKMLRSNLATSDQGERSAIIAYINSTVFDQLTQDAEFITYFALYNPNYKFRDLEKGSYYEACYGGQALAQLWPIIGDLLQDKKHLTEHGITPLHGHDLQEIYNYMVVYNKSKLKNIPAKHPPVIAPTGSTETNNLMETTAEVVNG